MQQAFGGIKRETGLRQVVVVQLLSHVWLFLIAWAVAHQAPLPMGFPRQEHWSGLLFPSLCSGFLAEACGILAYPPGIELTLPALEGDYLTTKLWGKYHLLVRFDPSHCYLSSIRLGAHCSLKCAFEYFGFPSKRLQLNSTMHITGDPYMVFEWIYLVFWIASFVVKFQMKTSNQELFGSLE